MKELYNGSKAVAIFNTGAAYRNSSIIWKELDLKTEPHVRDLWRQKDMGIIRNEFKTVLPPHGAVLITVI